MLASKLVFSGSTEEFVFITEWNVISQYENAIDNIKKSWVSQLLFLVLTSPLCPLNLCFGLKIACICASLRLSSPSRCVRLTWGLAVLPWP